MTSPLARSTDLTSPSTMSSLPTVSAALGDAPVRREEEGDEGESGSEVVPDPLVHGRSILAVGL